MKATPKKQNCEKRYTKKVAICVLNNNISTMKTSSHNYTIVGFDYESSKNESYKIEKSYLIPTPSNGFDELKSRLEYLKEKANISVIIPNLEEELPLYIENEKLINEMGIELCLPNTRGFKSGFNNRLYEATRFLNFA